MRGIRRLFCHRCPRRVSNWKRGPDVPAGVRGGVRLLAARRGLSGTDQASRTGLLQFTYVRGLFMSEGC